MTKYLNIWPWIKQYLKEETSPLEVNTLSVCTEKELMLTGLLDTVFLAVAVPGCFLFSGTFSSQLVVSPLLLLVGQKFSTPGWCAVQLSSCDLHRGNMVSVSPSVRVGEVERGCVVCWPPWLRGYVASRLEGGGLADVAVWSQGPICMQTVLTPQSHRNNWRLDSLDCSGSFSSPFPIELCQSLTSHKGWMCL